jgi:hypothetical protein
MSTGNKMPRERLAAIKRGSNPTGAKVVTPPTDSKLFDLVESKLSLTWKLKR